MDWDKPNHSVEQAEESRSAETRREHKVDPPAEGVDGETNEGAADIVR